MRPEFSARKRTLIGGHPGRFLSYRLPGAVLIRINVSECAGKSQAKVFPTLNALLVGSTFVGILKLFSALASPLIPVRVAITLQIFRFHDFQLTPSLRRNANAIKRLSKVMRRSTKLTAGNLE
jgi:hypothetical protein